MKILFISALFSFAPALALAGSFEFDITAEFCEAHFNGEMAFAGEPYNVTNSMEENLPTRRLVSELVTGNVGYIWYEHGGRGYHQRLVRFNVQEPGKVLENYTFNGAGYTRIQELIDSKGVFQARKEEEL